MGSDSSIYAAATRFGIYAAATRFGSFISGHTYLSLAPTL